MAQEIIETHTVTDAHNEAAQRLFDAAQEYWDWRNRHGLPGAVIWLRDDLGRLLVFTRGEYDEAILNAIRQQDGLSAAPEWRAAGGGK